MKVQQPIRNNSSNRNVKPRVCDVLIDDNDKVYLDFKGADKKHQVVLLIDVLKQVEEAMQKAKES